MGRSRACPATSVPSIINASSTGSTFRMLSVRSLAADGRCASDRSATSASRPPSQRPCIEHAPFPGCRLPRPCRWRWLAQAPLAESPATGQAAAIPRPLASWPLIPAALRARDHAERLHELASLAPARSWPSPLARCFGHARRGAPPDPLIAQACRRPGGKARPTQVAGGGRWPILRSRRPALSTTSHRRPMAARHNWGRRARLRTARW